jgi:prolyl 4-hydroxylase
MRAAPARCGTVLFLASWQARHTHSHHFDRRCAAFAGGFGAKKAPPSPSSSKKHKRKPSRSILDLDLEDLIGPPSPPSQRDTTYIESAVVELDKWGLPPPTDEDIFPLPTDDVELIPISKGDYSLDEIRHALKDYVPLTLDRFDEHGVEKQVSGIKVNNSHPRQLMKLRLLYQSPPVLVIDNFLTEQECVEIEQVAMPTNSNLDLQAVQVDSKTFALSQSTRTSTSWFCYFSQVPLLLAKTAFVLGLPLEQLEEPQIVRYKTGQEFSWHYDQVPTPQLRNGGQRVATLLVYLNNLSSSNGGGSTVFRDLRDSQGCRLSVSPKQGSALLFFPADAQGRPDDRTLHKGEPVLAETDEKRIVQLWTHQRPYQAQLPPDNRQEDARAALMDAARELGYI